ncbi:unnamed protein product [Cylindrotheca closterium]|uniref:Uncharacterized protein n=1 Tax=Cylindrotheca closterium TaxID=2856 RepID=A0AAD2CHE4_9STRA|nr:unnamed protein product [Cylindrotheca closterium]
MQQKIAINIISAVAEECELTAKEYQEKFDEVTQQWEPKFAAIAIFISWAKHSSRHFNNNTISLVQTIADQCGISTLNLMEEAKSYRMVWAEGGNSYQMQFAKTKGQDESEVWAVAPVIDKVIFGIQLTGSLFEREIEESGSTMLAAVGRKRKSRRDKDEKQFTFFEDQDGIEDGTSYTSAPRFAVHMLKSFHNRVWLEIEHRFLAYHIIKVLFGLVVPINEVKRTKNEI